MLTYIYSLWTAAVQPCHITALRGLSSCTGPTLFQSRAKACSDRATPSYPRFDTLAKSSAPPWIASSGPQPAVSSPLCNLGRPRPTLIATRSWARKSHCASRAPLPPGATPCAPKAVKAMGRRYEVQDGTLVATSALQPWLWAWNPTPTTPHTAAMLLLSYRVIYIPTPHPTPPPVHLPPIQPPTQLDTLLSYFPTLLSTSPLYNHQLSWTPYSPTFLPYCPPPPYTTTNSAGHHVFLLSYFSESPPGSPATPQPQLERPTRGAWSPSIVRNGRLRLF